MTQTQVARRSLIAGAPAVGVAVGVSRTLGWEGADELPTKAVGPVGAEANCPPEAGGSGGARAGDVRPLFDVGQWEAAWGALA